MTRFGLHHGIAPRAIALLETTGRRSGLPRYTPIGNGLIGDTFWLVAVHGRQADYVRNMLANPTVPVTPPTIRIDLEPSGLTAPGDRRHWPMRPSIRSRSRSA